ncbi:Poly [ADP-ribose] polymerase 8 [Vanrija pseudolonga]|uniref:Poly [ADP-ribose] polymerase 8 n=1 Tax=Vanrija pseudolonga TaxID=143232 RepID=A0AAF0Y9I0_9TREE|nr:Poly [ADP-ribose] polymerase 8 [Vanrija pseudolonga]
MWPSSPNKRVSPTSHNHPPSQRQRVVAPPQAGSSSATAINLASSDEENEEVEYDEDFFIGDDDDEEEDNSVQYLATPNSGPTHAAQSADENDQSDDEYDFDDDNADGFSQHSFGDADGGHLEAPLAIVGQGGLDDDIHAAQAMLENTGQCLISVRHGEVEAGGISTSTLRSTPGFPMGLQLCQTALNFFSARWHNRGESFLSDLCLTLKDRLYNSGNYCMMCDAEFTHPGVKPTICGKQLCAYQLETLGLGADLSLFDVDPAVADLLVTFATAACVDTARQQVSPVPMPVDHDDTPFTPASIVKVLNSIPAAETLNQAGEGRKALLDEAAPSAARVAAWLFATNRAHIVSVEPEHHIEVMKTPHQFHIHTSTRQHAEKFAKLRAEHGSFFAFHGSGLSNWHNILRQNLKVASKTPMMSTGAAYGEGIYMAAGSSTSAGYMRSAGRGWIHSDFGPMPVCLALVEVANSSRVHWHLQNQIVVANDESCVVLHHLFIYNSHSAIPHVLAKDVVKVRFKNTTTIAYGSSYEEVEREGKLLITSDEYFWDIEEVVGMIQAKHGLFINPYNQVPFAPADVKAIVNHPSGHGRVLEQIEVANAALRNTIPSYVYGRLRMVGEVCIRDTTDDFASAHRVIADLHEWLQTLPANVKDALARAPFEAVDSHTRQPFRDTVAHSVELVVSGGECVHRFGDFLKQVAAGR